MVEDDERRPPRRDAFETVDSVGVVILQEFRQGGQELGKKMRIDGLWEVRFHNCIHAKIITQ